MEEITLQVPSLDPRCAIFIDLCLYDFQAVESFTVQVNQLIVVSLLRNLTCTFSRYYMYTTMNFSCFVC